MTFIVFIGHGSREEQGNEEIRIFVQNLVQKNNFKNTEVCYLEFGTPDIATGIDNCVRKGASKIVAIPMILLPAGHSKLHIPHALDNARKKYPEIQFHYGTPVGTDIRILDILDDRLKSIRAFETTLPQNTAVLMVGRGSSDPDANSQLFRISRLFWERHKFQMVETAFMGITQPLFIEGLQKCRNLGADNIVVVPYFLFTGILMERMKKMTNDYAAQNPGMTVNITDYFGFHPLLEEVIESRIGEAIAGKSNLNCDLCQYRLGFAHSHEHHEHNHHDHKLHSEHKHHHKYGH